MLLWSIQNNWLIIFDYKLFFRDMLNLETSHPDREILKSRIKDLAFSSFKTYNSFIQKTQQPKNLNLSSIKVKIKMLLFRNLIKITLLFWLIKLFTLVTVKNFQLIPDISQKSVLTWVKNKYLFLIMNKKSLTFLRKSKIRARLMRICKTNYA